jgi:acyl-coenzyme A synthetase/AMP-(fatty) acid ligase
LAHPSLAEAVVVGVPDEDGLAQPVAYVVGRPGVRVDPDELIAFCRGGLASFKRPRLVVEVDELPKTATGKIQRYRLRALATATEAPVPTTPADVAEVQS